MNKLQLPQSKLLFAVAEAYRKRMIDQTQKRILKQKIITDNVQIFEILDQNDSQSALLQRLVSLVKQPQPQIEEPAQDEHDVEVPNPVQQEEASSPWGTFLMAKKIKKQHEHKNEALKITNLINPSKAQ